MRWPGVTWTGCYVSEAFTATRIRQVPHRVEQKKSRAAVFLLKTGPAAGALIGGGNGPGGVSESRSDPRAFGNTCDDMWLLIGRMLKKVQLVGGCPTSAAVKAGQLCKFLRPDYADVSLIIYV